MMPLARFQPFDRYLESLAGLTPSTLATLGSLVADDVHFRDPFNDCRGRDAFLAVFADMLEQLDDIAFTVTECPAEPRAGEVLLIRWQLRAHLPRLGGRAWSVTGCSALRFNEDGLLTEHLDYWDAASGLYELLPLVGPLMRALRRRLAVRLR